MTIYGGFAGYRRYSDNQTEDLHIEDKYHEQKNGDKYADEKNHGLWNFIVLCGHWTYSGTWNMQGADKKILKISTQSMR